MCEVKPYYWPSSLQWNVGPLPLRPEVKENIEYSKFYVNTGRRNGKTATTLTPVVPEIERVIFHEPATIVFWSDNTKTIVKCMEGELFDEEKGIAMAFMKKMYGDKYKQKIRRHIPVHAFTKEETE